MNQENESSENISEIASQFEIELQNSPEFSSYIFIDTQKPALNLTEYQHTYGELVNFYHFQIMTMKPHINLLSSDIIIIVSLDRLIYNELTYISKKAYKILSNSCQSNINKFSSFLEFLDTLKTKYMKFPISINSKKISDDFTSTPIKAKSLESFGRKIELKAHHKADLDPNNKKFFQKLITSLSPFLPKTLNLQYHCFQNLFNAVVSQEDFVFHNEIISFFNSFDTIYPFDFIETMLETCEHFIIHFQLARLKNSRIIIFILLNRYIFDQIYVVNHHFFPKGNENLDIIAPISKFTFQKMSLPLDYFPSVTKPRNTIRKILREDEFYKRAIDDLEKMQFFTSPFDICACVMESIQSIKKGADHYSKSSLDFDSNDLINLFMAVAIASDIPELLALSNFVSDYVYNSKSSEVDIVSNDLNRAKSVLIRGVEQLSEICEKEKQRFQ